MWLLSNSKQDLLSGKKKEELFSMQLFISLKCINLNAISNWFIKSYKENIITVSFAKSVHSFAEMAIYKYEPIYLNSLKLIKAISFIIMSLPKLSLMSQVKLIIIRDKIRMSTKVMELILASNLINDLEDQQAQLSIFKNASCFIETIQFKNLKSAS
jgi:hypothetical protein